MRNGLRNTAKAASVGIAALVIGLAAVSPHLSRDTYTATVTEKVVKRYGKSDKYLVFTKLQNGDIRVFENTDSLLEWKFDSTDVQAGIEQGQTYAIKAYGWRVPFCSWYENVLSARKVPKPELKDGLKPEAEKR